MGDPDRDPLAVIAGHDAADLAIVEPDALSWLSLLEGRLERAVDVRRSESRARRASRSASAPGSSARVRTSRSPASSSIGLTTSGTPTIRPAPIGSPARVAVTGVPSSI
jgi:hypothetical protein